MLWWIALVRAPLLLLMFCLRCWVGALTLGFWQPWVKWLAWMARAQAGLYSALPSVLVVCRFVCGSVRHSACGMRHAARLMQQLAAVQHATMHYRLPQDCAERAERAEPAVPYETYRELAGDMHARVSFLHELVSRRPGLILGAATESVNAVLEEVKECVPSDWRALVGCPCRPSERTTSISASSRIRR